MEAVVAVVSTICPLSPNRGTPGRASGAGAISGDPPHHPPSENSPVR